MKHRNLLISLSLIVFLLILLALTPQPKIVELSLSQRSTISQNVPRSFRRFAVFATSIHSKSRSYVFYMPIVAASWQRVGYEPIAIFVGDFNEILPVQFETQMNLTLDFLRRLNVKILNFQCEKSYAVKISQLIRIFSGFLLDDFVNENDLILTTDSDIVPMKSSNYELKTDTSGFIYNAFCCGRFSRRNRTYSMYPMSHFSLTKKIWKDLILQEKANVKFPIDFQQISDFVRSEFGSIYDSNMTKGDLAWYMDQSLASMLIDHYLGKNRQVQVEKRPKLSDRFHQIPPSGRWPISFFAHFGDGHLIHDAIFRWTNWNSLENLIVYLFNGTFANQFKDYYDKFSISVRELTVNEDQNLI